MADDFNIKGSIDPSLAASLQHIIEASKQLDASTKVAAGSLSDLDAHTKAASTSAAAAQGAVEGLAGASKSAAGSMGALSTAAHEAAVAEEHLAHEAEEAEGALEVLAGGLKSIAGAAATMGEAAEAAGLEVGGLAGKIGILGETLEALGTMAGPLLAIGVAIAAVGTAFSFIGEGVGEAAKMQSDMETLGAAVEAQHGDWEKAKDGVEEFIHSASIASGIVGTEFSAALNKAVTAGISLHDSEILASTAAEIATAKHISLEEAMSKLIQAEAGRGRGLVALDGNLKNVVASHGKMSEVVEILNRDMGNSIEKSNGLEMQQKRLKVIMDQLGESIGNYLLPFLTDMAIDMIGGIKAAEAFGSGVVDAFNAIGIAIQAVMASLGQFLKALDLVSDGDFAGAKKMWDSGINTFNAGTRKSDAVGNKALDELATGLLTDPHTLGQAAVKNAVKEFKEHSEGKLERDPNIQAGVPKEKKEKASKNAGDSTATATETLDGQIGIEGPDAQAKAHTALKAALDGSTGSEQAFRDAVALATTEQGKASAEAALHKQELLDLEAAHKLLNDAVAEGAKRQTTLTATIVSTTSADNSLRSQHDALAKAMVAAGGGTEAQKEKLNELNSSIVDQDNKLAALKKQQSENTTNLNTNTASLKANTAAIHDNVTAEAAKNAALVLADNDFEARRATKNAEEFATFAMTNAQRVQYYKNALAQLNAADINYYAQKHALETSEDAAEKALLQQQYDAYKKVLEQQQANQKKTLEQETASVKSFLDGVIVQHQSMADTLKSIYNSILKDFVEMVAKMIVESKLFGGISKALGLGGTSGSNSSSTGGSSVLSGLFGGSGQTATVNLAQVGGKTLPATPTAGSIPVELPTDSAGSSLDSAGANSYGFGSGNYGSSDPASGVTNAKGGSGLSGAFGGALEGVGIGGTIASLDGGNSMYASLIGGAGGAIGTAFGGPVGGAIGSVAGGLIGSFLGPHWGPATNYPDRSDTQNYGQFVSDINGQTGSFNGTQISPETKYSALSGNTSEASQIAAFVKNAAALTTLTTAQQAVVAQLKALGGANQNYGIANEKNGMFTLGSGQQISVTDYENLIAQEQQISTASGSSTAPQFTVTRMAPNYNTANLTPWTANTANNGTTTSNGGVRTTLTDAVAPVVNVTVNAALVGMTTQALATEVTKQVTRNMRTNYQNYK